MPKSLHFMFYGNASAEIGAGHIMRLFSLAQASKEAHTKHGTTIQISFASYECPEQLQDLITSEGFAFQLLPRNFGAQDISSIRPDVIFIDDYLITESQLASFVQSQAYLVRLDDNLNNEHVLGDLVINASSNAIEEDYRKRNKTATLCLGPKFSLLRKEFWNINIKPLSERKQILVSLGASDVKNMALVLTKSLLSTFSIDENVDICVLLGGLNNNALAQLQDLANKNAQLQLVQHSNQVSTLMMNAGLAISAAGGSLNELACTGTPAIALVSVDNQKAALAVPAENAWYIAKDIRDFPPCNDPSALSNQSQAIIDNICARSYELWRDLCTRESMSSVARQKIDGNGCKRIIDIIMAAIVPKEVPQKRR